jgi:hypothetical protein
MGAQNKVMGVRSKERKRKEIRLGFDQTQFLLGF